MRSRVSLARALGALLPSTVAAGVALLLVPGISVDSFGTLVLLAFLIAAVGALATPLLLLGTQILGPVLSLLLGLVAQVAVVWVALSLTPGVAVASARDALLLAVLVAVVSAAISWLVDASTDDAVMAEIVYRVSRRVRPGPTTRPPGLLVVQVDGLSAPLLRWALASGQLPTLNGWLRSGTHHLTEWSTGLPATTPASQAGLLHGRSDQVPAFRWYEKEHRRLLVANRSKDAAEIEARLSDGRGLLADGGVSISNIFSGDAAEALLTMSKPRLPGGSRSYARYVVTPAGMPRALVLFTAEMVKELLQGRRQRRRGIEPRVHRGGSYVVLRAVTNVVLRQLNVALIAEHMIKAAPVIFCDFVDYDEIAHHAGPARPESLAALAGIDRVLGWLEEIAALAPRAYRIVALSDHGQSQGATFRQRSGVTLEEFVGRLLDGRPEVAAALGGDEQWGPVNALLTDVVAGAGPVASAGRRTLTRRGQPAEVALGPGTTEVEKVGARPASVVIASGNLAMIYLADEPDRVNLEYLTEHHPRLVPALVAHPAIGLVVVRSTNLGPVAVGDAGTCNLDTGEVRGLDPLLPYGQGARQLLLRHQSVPNVGDLVVISAVDSFTGEVSAFEELVGCHGGLGGDQTQAVLIHPVEWPLGGETLDDPAAVHRQLVRWLEESGLRTSPSRSERKPAP